LLAKLQLDHVLSFRHPKKRMSAFKTVPRTPDLAYQDVLRRINERPGDQDLVMEILGWIFHAQRILRMDELLEALSFGEDDVATENELSDDEKGQDDDDEESGGEDETDEEDKDAAKADATADCELDLKGNQLLKPNEVLECCRGLVVYEESTGLVQFSHETVRTFIERELEPEHPTAINIAKTCITYLASVQFDSPCVDKKSLKERAQKYKFSRYAAQFWGLHTRGEAENEPDVQRAILSLLASENKKDSMLQLETYANSSWGNISFTKGQTLLHVIAKNGLATICKWVLDGRINGNDTYALEVDIGG